MGLIIGKAGIPMFKVGYPTVSDKYNITGGTLVGETPVKFGDLVKFSATKGYYEAITAAVTVDEIAGFVLATNVKLATEWPGTDESVKVLPGPISKYSSTCSCSINLIALSNLTELII